MYWYIRIWVESLSDVSSEIGEAEAGELEKSGSRASQSDKEGSEAVEEEEEGLEAMDTEAAGVAASNGEGVVAEDKVNMQACSVCLQER